MAGTQAHNTLAAVVQQRNNAASVGWIWMRFVPSKLSIEMPLGGGGGSLGYHWPSTLFPRPRSFCVFCFTHSNRPTRVPRCCSDGLCRWAAPPPPSKSPGCRPECMLQAMCKANVALAVQDTALCLRWLGVLTLALHSTVYLRANKLKSLFCFHSILLIPSSHLLVLPFRRQTETP